jgi:hypothetical protein
MDSTIFFLILTSWTIEEFRALDVDAIIERQQSILLSNLEKDANRFVVFMFGDLKNYKYYYRYCTLNLDTSNVNQTYANLVGPLIKDK